MTAAYGKSMIDATDKRIITELRRDGRLSWVQLAENVNLSASACQRRVEALVSAAVIERFTIKVAPQMLGQNIQAVISIKVERQKIESADAFRKKLISYNEVHNFVKLSGSIDYQITVWVEDIKALSHFIDNKLLALDGVVDANSAIVLESYPCAPYHS